MYAGLWLLRVDVVVVSRDKNIDAMGKRRASNTFTPVAGVVVAASAATVAARKVVEQLSDLLRRRMAAKAEPSLLASTRVQLEEAKRALRTCEQSDREAAAEAAVAVRTEQASELALLLDRSARNVSYAKGGEYPRWYEKAARRGDEWHTTLARIAGKGGYTLTDGGKVQLGKGAIDRLFSYLRDVVGKGDSKVKLSGLKQKGRVEAPASDAAKQWVETGEVLVNPSVKVSIDPAAVELDNARALIVRVSELSAAFRGGDLGCMDELKMLIGGLDDARAKVAAADKAAAEAAAVAEMAKAAATLSLAQQLEQVLREKGLL